MKNLSIKSKVIITAILILSTVSLTAIFAIFISLSNNQLNSSKHTQFRITNNLAEILHLNLKMYENNIVSFTKAITFDRPKQEIQDILESYKNTNGYINVFAAFEDGDLFVNSSYKVAPDYDPKTRVWYKNGINSNGIVISEPYLSFSTKKMLISFSYPLKKKDGTKGVFLVDLTFNIDNDLQEMPNKDYNGQILVIHNSGMIVSALNKELIYKNIKELFPQNLYDYTVDRMNNHQQQYIEPVEYEYNNHSKLAQIMPVKDYDFNIFYEFDKNLMFNAIIKSSLLLSLTILLIAVIGIGILYTLLKVLLSPLGKYSSQIYKMAENKDLKLELKYDKNDELGSIINSINSFNKATSEIVSEVRSSIIEVSSANNELAATMEEFSATFSSQAEQINNIVIDMNDIKNNSETATSEMEQRLSKIDETTQMTIEGQNKLNNVKNTMVEISNNTNQLSKTIDSLLESSTHIGEIITVINDIANQTNLLALNAAIEAARAGEAGRGFAVVADEVRKLAERTTKATSEVENIISTLQNESEQAASAMKLADTSVANGVNMIEETASSFAVTVHGVNDIANATHNMIAGFEKQFHTIQDVTDKTQNIANGIEESNAAVNEVDKTISHIQQRTERLKMIIEQFKGN